MNSVERKIAAALLTLGLCLGGVAQGADSPEEVFWQSVKKSDVVEEYRIYVEQYPKGKYLGEAWKRIGRLEGEAEAKRQAEEAARREEETRRQTEAAFRLTSGAHHMNKNLDAVCRQAAGKNYRLADWNDVRAQYQAGKKADEILPAGSAFVSWAGKRNWRSGRHYIATRANHRRDPGYLAHDTIDNQLFDLGSWYPSYPVLCFSE